MGLSGQNQRPRALVLPERLVDISFHSVHPPAGSRPCSIGSLLLRSRSATGHHKLVLRTGVLVSELNVSEQRPGLPITTSQGLVMEKPVQSIWPLSIFFVLLLCEFLCVFPSSPFCLSLSCILSSAFPLSLILFLCLHFGLFLGGFSYSSLSASLSSPLLCAMESEVCRCVGTAQGCLAKMRNEGWNPASTLLSKASALPLTMGHGVLPTQRKHLFLIYKEKDLGALTTTVSFLRILPGETVMVYFSPWPRRPQNLKRNLLSPPSLTCWPNLSGLELLLYQKHHWKCLSFCSILALLFFFSADPLILLELFWVEELTFQSWALDV